MKQNLIILGSRAHGIVTRTGNKIFLSKTGPYAVISSQISLKFTEAVYCVPLQDSLAFWDHTGPLAKIFITFKHSSFFGGGMII